MISPATLLGGASDKQVGAVNRSVSHSSRVKTCINGGKVAKPRKSKKQRKQKEAKGDRIGAVVFNQQSPRRA